MKRYFSLILILFLFFAAGCSDDLPEEVVPTETQPASEDVLIAPDGSCPYVIIRPDARPSDAETDGALAIQQAILNETGVKLTLSTDFVKAGTNFTEAEHEILIGRTDRDAADEAMKKLVGSRDWYVGRSGSKIVICGSDDLDDAITYFIRHHVKDGNISIADGEEHLYTAVYELASLTIAGTPIRDYAIRYQNNKNDLPSTARAIQSWIREKTGYTLSCEIQKSTDTSPTILITTDFSNPDQVSLSLGKNGINVSSGILVRAGDTANGFFSAIHEQSEQNPDITALDFVQTFDTPRTSVADEAYLASLDKKANAMKQAVLGTESEWTVGDGGRIFYFSENGSDTNDGLSESSPKQTLSAIPALNLQPGDVVLFRRGDMFRGRITANDGVTYSAYGEGDKPIINASTQNYAVSTLWATTRYENVWRLTVKQNNVGIMLFDRTWKLGNYHETYGLMKTKDVDGFNSAADLGGELEFYTNLDTKDLYLYCSAGNPGEVFGSIEIGAYGNAISIGSARDVTVDNLHITMTGSHGVGAHNCKNLTVRNCVFDWLGGSILRGYNGTDMTRYGNAVEALQDIDGYHVYNNWIYQIYDTGVTHQYSNHPEVKSVTMNDIQYRDNLIEYCYWSIEYYNTVAAGTQRFTTNVDISGNFCRFGGEGWGCLRREDTAPMVALNFSGEKCTNFNVHDNIFDRCTGVLLRYGADTVKFSGNTYIQHFGESFMQRGSYKKPYDITALGMLSEIGDYSSSLVFLLANDIGG